jgi:nicotinate-nucleotide adenylyltransferase
MKFVRLLTSKPQRLAILPGTFNPVTVAHLALARNALSHADEVVFVLPQVLPHKDYSGATFDQRLELLAAATAAEPRFAVASSRGGLFREIAAEFREVCGPGVRLVLVCGRDAAERIAGWDYGRPGAFPEMLHEFELLVAHRNGQYVPPEYSGEAIRLLEMGPDFDPVSASEVRARLAAGLPWEHLVPAAVRDRVREIYGAGRKPGPG